MTGKYRIEADTHCHTVASTHAYGTIAENAAAAKQIGLTALAITDHGPRLPDSPHPWHFYNMRVLPAMINGVLILRGVEANILDTDGRLDMEAEDLQNLDWVIASFHKQTFRVSSPAIHTEAMVNATLNRYVDVIGHPDSPDYPIDIAAVVKACRDNGKFIEMNNSSFTVRKGGQEMCRQIALECMKHQVQVVISSDAHCPWDIGETATICRLLDSIGFPEELVFNRKTNHVAGHINTKHSRDVYNRM
ncbi:MAG: phosphatase [Saccharofermentanales bacterium]